MNQMETAVTKATSVGAHSAAAATTYFGLTLNDLGVAVGIVSTVLMLAINFYFQWRRDKREEHAARQLERRKGAGQ